MPYRGWIVTLALLAVWWGVGGGGVATGEEDEFALFDNGNPDAVADHPPAPAIFDVEAESRLCYLMTYHWHGGRGRTPGSIALVAEDGRQLGPWPAIARPGRAPVYWECRPDVVLTPGRWAVVDSHPESWAHNAKSGGAGVAVVRARLTSPVALTPLEVLAGENPAAALPFLDKRIQANPDDAEAYRLRARVHGSLAAGEGSREHAAKQRHDLDRLIALRPHDAQPLADRAWLRFMGGDQDGAIQDYEAAARIEPEDPVRSKDLAFALIGAGRQREAAEAYAHALGVAPGDPTTLLHRGALLEALGETAAAAEGYRRVLVLLHSGTLRDDAATRLAELASPGTASVPTPPSVPSSPAESPGAILATRRVGPAGGSVRAASGIRLDFPAGALDAEAEVVVRRGPTDASGASLLDVTINGARQALDHGVRVSLPMKPGLDSARVHAGLRVGERLWVELPGAYDAREGTLTFETRHFSMLGGLIDTGTLKWAVGGGIVVVAIAGGGWLIAGSAAAAVKAAGAATTLDTLAVAAGTLFFGKLIGDAAYDQTRAAVLGLDKVLAVPGFQILYTDDPKNANAIPTKDWGTVVLDAKSKQFVTFMRGRRDSGEFKNGTRYTWIHFPWSVVNLAFELMTVRHYYDKAGYRTRPRTVVYVCEMTGGGDGTRYGSWEAAADEMLGGVLNVNAKLLDSASDGARRAMLAHESWHAIAKANGLENTHAAWVDEAVAWAMEGVVFQGTNGFLEQRSWLTTMQELRRGLVLADKEDVVKRGTFLWPFARYLLHRGGHEEVRDLVSGSLGRSPELLKQHWRGFVRSLLTEEHRLADSYPQDPAVTMVDGKPLEIPSGWGMPTKTRSGLDLNDLAPGPIQPGVANLPASMKKPRPLSLGLFRALAGNPPPPIDGVPPPLVLRRATPTELEEYAILKPPTGEVSRPRAPDDVRIERRSVVAPGAWLAGTGTKSAMLTAGVVGLSPNDELVAASPLWLYWLDAPRFDRIEPLPDNDLWTRLHWIAPIPGGKGSNALSPQDCYAEYRLLGFDENGKETVLASALKDHLLAPRGGKGHFDVSVVHLQSYAELGLVTIDKAATADDGTPLASPIRRFRNPVVYDATYPGVAVAARLAYRFQVTGTLKENGQTDDSTLQLDRALDPTTWQGRDHTETWEERGATYGWKIRMAVGDERLESVTINCDRDQPERKVTQRFTFKDVPQIYVADLGPEGPLLRFYALQGGDLAKHAVEANLTGSGTQDEYDPDTGKSKKVTWATKFVDWNPDDCRLLVEVSSMKFEDLKKKAEAGLIDREDFERRYQAAMEAAHQAFDRLGSK